MWFIYIYLIYSYRYLCMNIFVHVCGGYFKEKGKISFLPPQTKEPKIMQQEKRIK